MCLENKIIWLILVGDQQWDLAIRSSCGNITSLQVPPGGRSRKEAIHASSAHAEIVLPFGGRVLIELHGQSRALGRGWHKVLFGAEVCIPNDVFLI